MELNIRRLNKSDYKTLVKWWDWWPGWQAPPLTLLPDTGLIVEKNGIGIVAGYIYMTNSKAALFDWVISNPEYRESDIKHVFSFVRHKNLLNVHKELEWEIDKIPSHEIIKNL